MLFVFDEFHIRSSKQGLAKIGIIRLLTGYKKRAKRVSALASSSRSSGSGSPSVRPSVHKEPSCFVLHLRTTVALQLMMMRSAPPAPQVSSSARSLARLPINAEGAKQTLLNKFASGRARARRRSLLLQCILRRRVGRGQRLRDERKEVSGLRPQSTVLLISFMIRIISLPRLLEWPRPKVVSPFSHKLKNKSFNIRDSIS